MTPAAIAAKEIRARLKAAGIEASVTSSNFSMGNSVDIRVQDVTPATMKKIHEIADPFQYGEFDGMGDCYRSTNRRSDLPAQAKYVRSRLMGIDTEELDMLFQPYMETPDQYADARRPRAFEPERRPFAAAFASHVYDCIWVPSIAGVKQRARERWQAEALAWLKSDSEADLSFRWYCELLGYDARGIRKQVLEGNLSKRERATPR